MNARDLAIIFEKYRQEKNEKFKKSIFFARINIFKNIIDKYGESFSEYLLNWAIQNEKDFYSPKYLFLIADKVKPEYEKYIKQQIENLQYTKQSTRKVEVKYMPRKKQSLDFLGGNDLSAFD